MFCRAMRTSKNRSNMLFVEPCGQLKTFQTYFFWSMQMAKDPSKLFSSGPCEQFCTKKTTLRDVEGQKKTLVSGTASNDAA